MGFAVRGLIVVRRDRWAGYVAFRRAVLVSLLVTQVFLFRIEEWAATRGLLADLAVLGLVSVELSQMDAQRRERAVRGARGRPGGAPDAPGRAIEFSRLARRAGGL